MKFGKFQNYLDSFGLVGTRKASVLFTVENSFTTFVNQVWADGIFVLVESLVEVFLFGQQHDSSIVGIMTGSDITTFEYCILDVRPHVWSVISIEVDYLFSEISYTFGPFCSVIRMLIFLGETFSTAFLL